MIKNILMLVFLFLTSTFYAYGSDFKNRQERITFVKKAIQEEESIANAYEQYLLNELKRAQNISDLINDDYLGSAFSSSFSNKEAVFFNDYVLSANGQKINYRLKDVLKNDKYLKRLYESDTYRLKTFFYKDSIQIILEDDFAKNLVPLLDALNTPTLYECSSSLSEKYCIKDGHIYIYESNSKANLLMYYYLENFKTGPIIINDDLIYHEKEEFKYLLPGVKLIDFKNQKYLKVSDGIRKLQ